MAAVDILALVIMFFVLWSLVFGLWSLVIGLWSLVIGHWSLVIGHWSLVIGHWSLKNLETAASMGSTSTQWANHRFYVLALFLKSQ
ncbi:TPA: hypothetical protein U2Q46_004388 [Klebsiella aerogenes]|nr:hypothetical protein [Klebsiella aerogenes]